MGPIPDRVLEWRENGRRVLFSVFGFDIQSYEVSKTLAALVAALLLARAFERLNLKRDYYLIEPLPTLTIRALGGMSLTWYGGLIGGAVAGLVIVHHQLPLGVVAGADVPLTVAYGIGRLGCLHAGDGTYGRPTSVAWAMAFPNGLVPTNVLSTRLPCTRPWPPWRSPHSCGGSARGGHRRPARRDEAMTVRSSA